MEEIIGPQTQNRTRLYRAKKALSEHPSCCDETWQVEALYIKNNHPRGGRSLFRARSIGQADSVILKVYDIPGRAQIEFDLLETFSQMSRVCLRPKFVMPQHNLVAMDDLGDVTALDLLLQPATERRAMDACLNWLHRYANETSQGVRPFEVEKLLREIRKDIDALPTDARIRSDAAFVEVERRIRGFDAHPFRHIRSFGDVKPSNICFPDGAHSAIAIDPVWDGDLPAERDLAFLLHWCRTMYWRRSLRKGGAVNETSERLDLDAVGAIFGSDIERNLLDAILHAYLLQLWCRVRLREREPRLQAYVEARLGMHP